MRVGRHGVEPGLTAIEEDHDDIRQRTWAEATANGQMHAVPQTPPLPLLLIEFARHRHMTVLETPAAAGVGADEQLAQGPRDPDATAIRAIDDIAHGERAGGYER